jgi:hypothetical protein
LSVAIDERDKNGDDEDLAPIVPAAFSETVSRRERFELKPYTFEGLKGERVVVRANGFEYRGVLIGADEGELYLRGELRYIVLPLEHVTHVERESSR